MKQGSVEQKASELGLSQLAADHPDELKTALAGAAALAERLPKDLHWTEEPAHTYRATTPREPRR